MQNRQFGNPDTPPTQGKGMTTQSIYIPMRDGVRLAADIILPANLPPNAKIPTLLVQSRYWRAVE